MDPAQHSVPAEPLFTGRELLITAGNKKSQQQRLKAASYTQVYNSSAFPAALL